MRTTRIILRFLPLLTFTLCALASDPSGLLPLSSVERAELTASDGMLGDSLGYAVAINGNTAVTGAPSVKIGSNRSQGAAYIFLKPTTGWSTTSSFAAKLTASDGAAGDSFGQAVAINGNTVVVGAPFKYVDGVPQGEVYVFVKPSSGWTSMTETAKLNPSDASTKCSTQSYCTFGGSVAIDRDAVVAGSSGNTVGSNTLQGAMYVFVKPVSGWTNMTQTAKLTNSAGQASDQLGFSVAISGSAVVGRSLTLKRVEAVAK